MKRNQKHAHRKKKNSYEFFRYKSIGNVKITHDNVHSASYAAVFSLFFVFNRFSTKFYDKRDDFNFRIVNFPSLSRNIPSGPSYCVVSQLIIYYMHVTAHITIT